MQRTTKVFSKQATVLVALFILTIFHACLDDNNDKGVSSSSIQFNNSSQSVTEGKETIIYLTLDKPAPNDGNITIEIVTNQVYSQHFTTDPASNAGSLILPIVKGQRIAQFKVFTVDNTSFDISKSITFMLGTRTLGLQLGVTTTCMLTIEDDEGPSVASFQISSGLVDETNGEGVEVKILLSSAAKGQGRIELDFISALAIYGTHFTTSPAATNNTLAFDISQDQTSVVFRVFPINNTLYTDSLRVTFSITTVGGAVEKGNNTTYALTIVDDEKPLIINFANESGQIGENNTEGLIVEIPFSDPAPEPGTIRVSLASPGRYGQDFITEPAGFGGIVILKVNKDQSSASFKVVPLDNSYSNYYKTVQFILSVIDGPLVAGSEINYTVTIIDNEIAEASFAETKGAINENNASGIQMQINFNKPLSQATQLYIRGPVEQNKVSYGVAYSTNPEMNAQTYFDCGDDYYYDCNNPVFYTYYQVLLLGEKGATSLEFTIIPIDNAVKSGNRNISFSLFPGNESPLLVSVGEYTLTLVDND